MSSLVREFEAIAALKKTLADLGHGEDGDLLLDMAEGETGIMEMIDGLLAADLEDFGLETGIDAMIASLETRKGRVVKRQETRRMVIGQAMRLLEQTKIVRPAATISIGKKPRGLDITDETEIPTRFWKTGKPSLDKKALKEALEAELAKPVAEREDIPGATLDNGGEVLRIARK